MTEFRKRTLLKVAEGESVPMVKWHYDYTYKDWGIKNYTQISIEQWKDGNIINEKILLS